MVSSEHAYPDGSICMTNPAADPDPDRLAGFVIYKNTAPFERELCDINYLASSFRQDEQIHLSLKSTTSSLLPQKTQVISCFFMIIESPSTYISSGSRSEIPIVRRNSIGRTIRPSSSTFLTIPVDFITKSLHQHRIQQFSVTFLVILKDGRLNVNKHKENNL